MLMALGRLKNSMDKVADEAFGAKLFYPSPSISDMKNTVLEKVIPSIKDTKDGGERAAIKEFMTSIYNNGEYLTNNFVEAFKSLPDACYGAYKEEFLEKALNTAGNYRTTSSLEQFIYNFKLLKTIDINNHKNFIVNNLNSIKNAEKSLDEISLRKLTDIGSFECYSRDFASNKIGEWQAPMRSVFWKQVVAFQKKTAFIAKKLKITEEQAKDVIKDAETLLLAEKAQTKEEALEICKNRISEKFSTMQPFREVYQNTDYGEYISPHFACKLDTLELKLDNINSFVEKTKYSEELKNILKRNFENLENEIEQVGDRLQYENAHYDKMDEIRYWSHLI